MSGWMGDVRLAFRRVLGSPALTLLIVATFALGIGANTAVFSLFDQVRLRSMPVKDPGSLNPALAGYNETQKRSLFNRVAAELTAQPDIASVGLSDNTLLTNSNSSSTIRLPGYTPSEEENMNPLWLSVSPGFFGTINAPIVQGRGFDERDGAEAPKVAIVNESFAKHCATPSTSLSSYLPGRVAARTAPATALRQE